MSCAQGCYECDLPAVTEEDDVYTRQLKVHCEYCSNVSDGIVDREELDIDWDMFEPPAQDELDEWMANMTDPPVCTGMLCFFRGDRPIIRFCALFKDHLDAWDSIDDAMAMVFPDCSVAVEDISGISLGVEGWDCGLTLSIGVHEVAVGLDDAAVLLTWRTWLLKLVDLARGQEEAAASAEAPKAAAPRVADAAAAPGRGAPKASARGAGKAAPKASAAGRGGGEGGRRTASPAPKADARSPRTAGRSAAKRAPGAKPH